MKESAEPINHSKVVVTAHLVVISTDFFIGSRWPRGKNERFFGLARSMF